MAEAESGSGDHGTLVLIVAGAVFFVGGLVIALSGDESDSALAPAAPPPPAAPTKTTPPDVAALLGGLRVGDTIEGWPVVETDVVDEKQLWIGFGKGAAEDEAYFRITVTRDLLRGAEPPRKTEQYELYTGDFRGRSVPPADVQKVLTDVEHRIRDNEHKVPIPAGL